MGAIFFRPLFYVAVLFFFFCVFFFRNPGRDPALPYNDTINLCPADGKVVGIHYDPQAGFEGYHQKISIFLSPLDVHVNWVPVKGVVEAVRYHKGEFVPAFLPKSSHLNERNDVCIRMHNGKTILVRQIAGTIARVICCWVQDGQQVTFGQKYGMIKFGSRVDILLPQEATIDIAIGDRVSGGHTILGRWQS
jgi:phosphatidylserine decarboxylase